jgi:hypothetical protein
MPPCHTKPFVQPGVMIVRATDGGAESAPAPERNDLCDYCASPRLQWRKCKLICADCHQINKSCADL